MTKIKYFNSCFIFCGFLFLKVILRFKSHVNIIANGNEIILPNTGSIPKLCKMNSKTDSNNKAIKPTKLNLIILFDSFFETKSIK